MMLKPISIVLALVMVGSSLAAVSLRPEKYLADVHKNSPLQDSVPKSFSGWHAAEDRQLAVVSPDQRVLLDSLYSDMLTRTYIDKGGRQIMVSIAYGKTQSDDKSVHYPDVCYPAQGFSIKQQSYAKLPLKAGNGDSFPVKRLVASQGARNEPITYWVMVGDKVTVTPWDHKKVQLSYGFEGYIPDGMLIRLSSIGADNEAEWELQSKFAADLLAALDEKNKRRFFGV